VRVAVTGTPGTGKTSATAEIDSREEGRAADFEVIHLNGVIESEGLTAGRDDDRESLIADFDAIEEWLAGRDDIVVESHLAHQFPMDRVVVLRCHPEELETRLSGRDESAESIAENAESEALDVILSEAVEKHGADSVYEVDATDRDIEAVATEIERVIDGERDPSAGDVSFIDYL
jgi:adenylate kinase